MKEQTRDALINHAKAYPLLQAEDIFKYLFQSAFGCEHLVSDEENALRYIQKEYTALGESAEARIESLDGSYSRVYLGILDKGLRPQTLARLFCLSAQAESDGKEQLIQKLAITRELVEQGALPLDPSEFDRKLNAWRESDYPALHHSDSFRTAYRPAYRVIANKFVKLLPVFCAIDKLLAHGSTVIAVEGGSASGKTTLASLLQQVYGCRVFHMDDFFLRPEQRTPSRLAEPGGNLDRERFIDEVLHSVNAKQTVCYRRFDCAVQALREPVTVPPAELTVVEGAYSMHPAFGAYYDLSIFLDIDPALQHQRITVRNSPQMAKRFFDEWTVMENTYFAAFDIKSKAHLLLSAQEIRH